VASAGGKRKLYKVFVGRPKGKKPLGRSRCRWEDEIRMDFGDIGWGVWSGFSWLSKLYGPVTGSCECGDELLYCSATGLFT
jgi:hypothetical protein